MIFNNFRILCLIIVLISTFQLHASDYYWVGGSGKWSQYSTHWATTSGGSTFYTQVPSPFDNVYFDANSFSASTNTLTLDQTVITCLNMVFSTGTKTITLTGGNSASAVNIYGNLQLAPGITINYSGNFIFKSSGNVNTIAQNGATITSYSQFSFNDPA
jgi:hypothetical protein